MRARGLCILLSRCRCPRVFQEKLSPSAQDNPLQLPLKKCAVVGNGGILRHSKCGKDIDQADFIMR